MAARQAHNLNVGGSIPPPATTRGLATSADAVPTAIPRLATFSPWPDQPTVESPLVTDYGAVPTRLTISLEAISDTAHGPGC